MNCAIQRNGIGLTRSLKLKSGQRNRLENGAMQESLKRSVFTFMGCTWGRLMARIQPNKHDWLVVAHEHSPFKEYYHCERCNKYKDDAGNIYTRAQFIRIAQLQRLFQPDSNVRLTFDNRNFKSVV